MRRAFANHVYPRLPARLSGLLSRLDAPADTMRTGASPDEIRDVLDRFGLTDEVVRRLPHGLVNTSWTVGPSHVLRRYNARRSEEPARLEHDVLRYLGERGWPVSVPIHAADGSTLVRLAGSLWSLFPRLPGRQRPMAADLRGRGRMLARLHDELAAFPAPPDREMLSFDVNGWWGHGDRRGLRELVGELRSREPDLAGGIGAELDLAMEEILSIGLDGLGRTVVHGDYHGGNILYVRREVSGLLDFDFVHLDLAVVDLGIAAGFLRSPGFVAQLLRGYDDVRALDERDVRLIGPLIRARGLEHIAFLLAARPAATDEEVMAKVRSALEGVRRDRAGSRVFERALLRELA